VPNAIQADRRRVQPSGPMTGAPAAEAQIRLDGRLIRSPSQSLPDKMFAELQEVVSLRRAIRRLAAALVERFGDQPR